MSSCMRKSPSSPITSIGLTRKSCRWNMPTGAVGARKSPGSTVSRMNPRNVHKITATSYSLSFRDDCKDAVGRAMHGAVAERAGVRGYNAQAISCTFPRGVLIVIHKYSSNSSYPQGSGYPVPMDGELKYIHVVWIPAIPAGMTGFVTLVYNDERGARPCQ